MDAIIRKALEKDLYSRYKNGAEFAKDLTSVRFQILDDDYVPVDMTRFNLLRKMPLFVEFEDVEIWEVLRIGSWRQINESTLLMREGEEDRRFGVIIDGEVEVSAGGKHVCTLGRGELVGEMAYLDAFEGKRTATVVSMTTLTYLDISAQALALASEECLEHFRERMTSVVVKRMAQSNRRLGEPVEPAQQIPASVRSRSSFRWLTNRHRPATDASGPACQRPCLSRLNRHARVDLWCEHPCRLRL